MPINLDDFVQRRNIEEFLVASEREREIERKKERESTDGNESN